MRRERIAAPILTLLLVVSVVGGGFAPAVSPVGTAEAQVGGSDGPCDAADWFLTFLSPVGAALTEDCSTAGEVAEEWNETDAEQTRTQIHSQAGQLGAGNEQFLTGMSNSVTDSDTVAFSKGEAAAVEALANGQSTEVAIAQANDTIDDHYAIKQINIHDRWEVIYETTLTLHNRSETTTGVDSDFVTLSYGNNTAGTGGADWMSSTIEGEGGGFETTLVNGSTTNVPTLDFNANYYSDGTFTRSDSFHFLSQDYDPGGYVLNLDSVAVRPTDNLDMTRMNMTEMEGSWRSIESQSNQTKREVAVYVEESLAPAMESGNLDAENYVSPATLAQEYSQEYGNDTSYIRATAIAASAGMDTPDLENTGSMTVTHDGETYEGLLLSQEAPSDGWQSGSSYDSALLSGMQMFAVAGENSSIVELDGSFTVDSVTNMDGEQIDRATTFNVTYETSNASANYTAMQEQIRSLNKQIEERQAQATSGGSDSETTNSGGLLDQLAAALGVSAGAALAGVAAVVLLAARFYSP